MAFFFAEQRQALAILQQAVPVESGFDAVTDDFFEALLFQGLARRIQPFALQQGFIAGEQINRARRAG